MEGYRSMIIKSNLSAPNSSGSSTREISGAESSSGDKVVKEYIIELSLEGSIKQFAHGLGPGVFLQAEIRYELTQDQYESVKFRQDLLQRGMDLRREHVKINFKEKG